MGGDPALKNRFTQKELRRTGMEPGGSQNQWGAEMVSLSCPGCVRVLVRSALVLASDLNLTVVMYM